MRGGGADASVEVSCVGGCAVSRSSPAAAAAPADVHGLPGHGRGVMEVSAGRSVDASVHREVPTRDRHLLLPTTAAAWAAFVGGFHCYYLASSADWVASTAV